MISDYALVGVIDNFDVVMVGWSAMRIEGQARVFFLFNGSEAVH